MTQLTRITKMVSNYTTGPIVHVATDNRLTSNHTTGQNDTADSYHQIVSNQTTVTLRLAQMCMWQPVQMTQPTRVTKMVSNHTTPHN